MASNEKKWERPWSMDEIVENSENWSLAGDAALLNTMKAFAENLFTKSANISNNVDNLLHSLDEVGLKLSISQNEFLSLRNKQFIESRVYEDDETLDVKEEAKSEEKPLSEEEKEKLIKQSVQHGLHVMGKYFEKIQVSISDSEDEESDKSYILRPKDLYSDRPLPMIIGSEEWYKKWHVGLAESSSESESEKVSDTYSDSELGEELPKDLIKGSETSSELDYSSRTSENRPVANSTFNDSSRKSDKFASDDESEGQGSLPVKAPISSQSFAEQLATKLGNVISEREDVSPEINKKPIQATSKTRFAGDLFSDEPPPLDNIEDGLLPKSARQGLFSGGRGLFDDNDDDDLWNKDTNVTNTKLDEKRDVKQSIQSVVVEKVVPHETSLPKSSKVSRGLFDSDSESETGDDLFVSKPKQQGKQPFLQPFSTTAPLFDEEPPELETEKKLVINDSLKKKPIGGVSIFGKSDLFSGENVADILKSRKQEATETDQIKTEPNQSVISQTRQKSSKENIKSKLPSLFDDDDNVPSKPKKISLFDDDDDDQVEDVKPEFTENIVQPKKSTEEQNVKFQPPTSLFDESHNYNVKTVPGKTQKISLFDDDDIVKPDAVARPKKISLFDDDDELFKDDLFSSISSKKFTSDLFDDVKDTKDLFSEVGNTNRTPKIGLFSEDSSNEEGKPKKNLSLFSDYEEEGKDEEDLFVEKSDTKLETTRTDESDVDRSTVTGAEMEKEAAESIVKITKEISGSQLVRERVVVGEKKIVMSLFDDFEEKSDSEDLFKDVSVSKIKDEVETLLEDSTKDIGENHTTPNVFKEEPEDTQEITNPPMDTSNVTSSLPPKSAINLFGSSPPPDDDEWDTKSEQFSDTEDQFSYRIDYNTAGSSLFDNEPPSLNPNESSGIVRDQNVTRVDTDDSSFNPYASSSRRLSSDIFNEQQSQDSFFVTKNNKSESYSFPPALDKIPEREKFSHLDITPSGNLDDLVFTKEDSSVLEDDSQQEEATPTKPKKNPVKLFDDIFDDSMDSEELFSSVLKTAKPPKLSEKRLSLFENTDDGDDDDENKIVTAESRTEEKKIESATVSKEAEDKTQETAGISSAAEVKEPPKLLGSPGKLKHNLRINVAALMPGSTPPKLRDVSKSSSTDQVDATSQLSSPDTGYFTPTLSHPTRELSSTSSEKAVSFEDALDHVEVLHSVTKDRAKIPIKRRPSTRRGRQQAMQSSEKEFTTPSGDDAELTAGESPIAKVKSQLGETADLPKLDLSDPFLSPDEIKTPLFQTPVAEMAEPLMDRIQSSAEDEKNDAGWSDNKTDVFSGWKTKSSIFDSEDSDGELFGEGMVKKKAKNEDRIGKGEGGGRKKKSLFDDSSSDEDLFSSVSVTGSRRKETAPKTVEKKPPKQSTRKLENIEPDEDPLSSLLK